MAPAYGAAFGGIDNDQPEIKARQRHRARLDPKPKYPSKDCHTTKYGVGVLAGFGVFCGGSGLGNGEEL